ncbi:hypothetical protein EDB84DRAFT_1438591 [Lactarius hengduanensis]|nr:hypothetical protein EDB84DRAFT_1438591 [Lactarius hengduanensis]
MARRLRLIRAEGDTRGHTAALSLSPPALPFPLSAPPRSCGRRAHEGTLPPPPLSLSPPAPPFPLVRAAPFARRKCTRAHTHPSPVAAPPRSHGKGRRGHAAPRPPSAPTFPPCTRHPIHAERGRARANRPSPSYGAARKVQEGKAPPPPGADRGARGRTVPASPPHASHSWGRGLPAH